MKTEIIQNTLQFTLQSRKNILKIIESTPMSDLTFIPKNYNNNLIWNAGHILVTQQLLCYKLAGLPMHLEVDFVELFRKGTIAKERYESSIVDFITSEAEGLIHQMEKDYSSLDFSKYQSYPTSFGTTLNSIEDAITFNAMHECLHLGYMMSQKRTISAQK